jgi:predicted RNA binding protein YcfA (HicA-like mRNA interferase family)
MTRLAKLYAWILANPRASVSFREFQNLMEAFGFELVRIKGSHHQYRHAQVPGILSIQPVGKEAKSYQIGQFLDMVQQFGLTMGE